MGDIDALILDFVGKAFADITPEAFTPLSSARPHSAGVCQMDLDDLLRWGPAAPSRSPLEQTLYSSKLAAACDAVVACFDADDLLRFTCLSPACERVILQRRSQQQSPASGNDVLQAQVAALQAQVATLLSEAKNIQPKRSALQEIFNNPGMSSVALMILRCLKPVGIHQLACVSPLTCRDITMSFIQLQRISMVKLRMNIIEGTNNLSTARQEVQSLWKMRWQRLEEVAEQNRRMRCPTPIFVPSRLPEYRPNTLPVGVNKLSSQEAQEHYDALDSSSSCGIVDRVANRELSDFKAAYASFVTSWSKAVDIAETLGTGDVDKLKGAVVSLASSPQRWSEKEWCKEAIRMAAGHKKSGTSRTTSKVS
eukprot:GEMP01060309.1.p1 GENE.GEMP01060309.1~~GEMP01060309.1.p1  ORF type:complete len:367 (+),score=76.56 GEMP01060309.1:208-1308(+)